MASIFTTEDNVTIPGNFGKTISVPYFLQFVPGIVTEVITSDASFKSNNVTHFTNTIIAMPHITNQPKPRKANLTNSDRYYPLMRGFVDVPAKGDPVLLCEIGSIKYYMGPLNTQNQPNHNEDFLLRPEKNIKSEEIGDSTEVKDEILAKGQSLNFAKVNHKRMMKHIKSDLDKAEAINETHGDMMLEGRHGNSIRIGSRDVNPYVYISNGRSKNNFKEGLGDGTLISITKKGTLGQHFGGFTEIVRTNPDDSSTWEVNNIPEFVLASDMLSVGNERKISSIVKSINKTDDVTKLIYNYGELPYENQVLINSDRIIFNSKGRTGNIYLSSKNDIHIGAGNHLTISTNKNLIIESDKTYLGDLEKQTNKEKMEPMVLGNALFDIFDELFSILEVTTSNQYFPLTLAYKGSPLKDVLGPLRNKLAGVKSHYHFIEPNGRETQ